MFTGIIEEIGRIKKIDQYDKGLSFTIVAEKILNDINLGDSISVNGVCLTVSKLSKNFFIMDIIQETLNKSNLGSLIKGDSVNLERAMKLSDRLGGHIVQGHIETLGVILDKEVNQNEVRLSVAIEPEWMKYCVSKGSITMDGVSLTIASINGNIIDVALIPHTLENTTLGIKSKSDSLNIETDILGKYIDRLLTFDEDDMDVDKNILKAIRYIQYGES